jgi:hypothetical protein
MAFILYTRYQLQKFAHGISATAEILDDNNGVLAWYLTLAQRKHYKENNGGRIITSNLFEQGFSSGNHTNGETDLYIL